MPLFICLTYDNNNVPYGDDTLSLCRSDVSLFLKAYKARYNLNNSRFTYFGSGEYGEDEKCTRRPHYHLLFFGDDELYQLFYKDYYAAKKRLHDVWKKGFVDLHIAEWSGVHYVTKYCLKECRDDYDNSKLRPFTIASHGIGLDWLNTNEAINMKKQLQWLTYNRRWINETFRIPFYDNVDDTLSALLKLRSEMRVYFPDFKVTLPSGKIVPLPRELRRRLVGSFERQIDSPLWLWNYVNSLIESFQYLKEFKEYDSFSPVPMALQKNLDYAAKIQNRILHNRIKKRCRVK